jgi:hypothetical protein
MKMLIYSIIRKLLSTIILTIYSKSFSLMMILKTSFKCWPGSSFGDKITIVFLIRLKNAILTAIHKVTTEWIITTDADCIVHNNWLLTLDNYIVLITQAWLQERSRMIATVLSHQFQQLDMTFSLQGATIGSFDWSGFMCNGA